MSELGNLSNCMMDGDTEATARSRRLRREALIISLFVEAALVIAMLLWPLITPGVLPQRTIVTPLPPYTGARNSNPPARQRSPESAQTPHTYRDLIFRPAARDVQSVEAAKAGPPSLNDIPGAAAASGPTIPGAARDGAPINIAPPETHRGPIKASAGVMNARLIHRVEPEYPPIARAMRLSGTVELRAIIATDGSVRELEVVSGNAILARAALAAVEQWRYQPTRLNGEPLEVETDITVNFVME